MNRTDFESIVNAILQEAETSEQLDESHPLELTISRSSGKNGEPDYVDISTIKFFDSYCSFTVVGDPCVEWAYNLHRLDLFLPYSSILAVTRVELNYGNRKDPDISVCYRLIIHHDLKIIFQDALEEYQS